MFRKVLFWSHLCAGVAAGLVILMMSVTGVLLTYERQVLAWADRTLFEAPADPAAPRLGPEGALAALAAADATFEPASLTLSRDPRAPIVARAGRRDTRYVDPYSGAVAEESAPRLRAFFGAVTGWHRWFNVQGENRDLARAITGASNVLFLFIVLSGLYLWLPPVYRWVAFRTRLWFNPKATGSKARDFNWHHVFGIWSAVPLALVVASAFVFSYGWANDLLYRMVGEDPPARGRGGPPPAAAAPALPPADSLQLSLDALTARAMAAGDDWRTLTVQLPAPGATRVDFDLDAGSGGQPQHRRTLTLDAARGEVVAEQGFAALSAGRKARSILRFLHTGEVLGIPGQTIAGLVSFTSILMVWTGLALAWRRLVSPLFRRRRRELAAVEES